MKVPYLDLAAQLDTFKADIRAAIDRVLDSQQFILGNEVSAFEEEIARFCNVKHAVGVSNGSDAILATLLALGIGRGDEVIVPTFTFFATAGSVWHCGATPVFVDVLPGTLNMDPSVIIRAITPRTRAIMPVHLYGQCADMDAIMAVADKHGLEVVEDAAQAIGATYRGRPAGSIGTAGTFSFYPTKNLSAIGALAEKVRQIRNHGMYPVYHHHMIGGNFRMSGIQGAALRVKLPHVECWNAKRRENGMRYNEAFAGSSVTPPKIDEHCEHVFHQYTIRSKQRDALKEHLQANGIASAVFYPIPLHLQECFAHLSYTEGQCPVAELAAKEVLSLPVFPEMTAEQQQHVIDTVLAFDRQ
jgi:dTDP-4-amino-4,6-dideoxygalactose transaminase